MTQELKPLTIEKKKWARQQWARQIGGYPALETNKRKMCCLGFVCRKLHGMKPNQIRGVYLPSDAYIFQMFPNGPEISIGRWKIYAIINDSTTMSEGRKIKLLTKMFAEDGVEVTFV